MDPRRVRATGHQTVVFGRRGSRPFNEQEFAAFTRKPDGQLFRVEDVSVRNRQLHAASGTPLPPTAPFRSRPAEPVPARSTDRIFRRPAGTD